MKYVIAWGLVSCLYLASALDTRGQGPISMVDFRADSLEYLFPAPDSIVVKAYYTFFNGLQNDSVIASDILLFLDGAPVAGEPVGGTRALNTCWIFNTPEECKGECYLRYEPLEIGECWWVYRDPQDTFAEVCSCTRKYSPSIGAHYSGEQEISFYLDFDDVITEFREYNNWYTVNLGTIETRPSTWGRIKKEFEED